MQRIRNQYAGLLLTQVKQKNLKEPFDHLPKESPLQRIPTYILSQQRESTSGFWSKVSSRIQAQTESQRKFLYLLFSFFKSILGGFNFFLQTAVIIEFVETKRDLLKMSFAEFNIFELNFWSYLFYY